MIIPILLALICGNDRTPERNVKHVDIIEVNHAMDQKDGTHRYSQIILWKIHPEDGKPHVWGWRLLRHENGEEVSKHGSRYVVYSDEDPSLRIEAPGYRETWRTVELTADPERLDNRKFWKNRAPNLFHSTDGRGQPNPFLLEGERNDD